MGSYTFLLSLALILICTKVFGLVTEKVHLPQVVGAIIAGIILGPSGFGLVEESDFIIKTAEIGVIMLMFIAGLDTDMKQLKHTGGMACVIAILGVLVPIIGCGAVYYFFFIDSYSFENIIKTAFVGVVFAATSVSITVEALNEMGKLKTKVGATILNAAIIDDIIGIVVLSIVMGVADSKINPLVTVGKILLFFVFSFVIGFIVYKVFKKVSKKHGKSRRIAVWALAFCFLMSFAAEHFFGVADITGAYIAGVILCNLTKSRQFLAKKMTVASYVLFSPVFFANIGLKTDLSGFNSKIAVFALCLVVMSIITKIVGCGTAAKLCGLKTRESLSVGIGMVARGEVALMIAQKGIDSGYIEKSVFPAIVLCVIVAALATPILLKLSFKGHSDDDAPTGNGDGDNPNTVQEPVGQAAE